MKQWCVDYITLLGNLLVAQQLEYSSYVILKDAAIKLTYAHTQQEPARAERPK